MTLTIQPVDTNYISQVWPMVDGYLLDALVEEMIRQRGVIATTFTTFKDF
jgi:hypothetical protein